jgi:hypothetical protein
MLTLPAVTSFRVASSVGGNGYRFRLQTGSRAEALTSRDSGFLRLVLVGQSSLLLSASIRQGAVLSRSALSVSAIR